MRSLFALALVVTCIAACTSARAQVYRCTAANGSVGYQDHACAAGQKQKILDVPSRAPPGYVPPAPATTAVPETTASVLPSMGYPPQSLSQAYAAPGGAGMSAPELSRPRIGGPRIATGMTEVQDYCLPAT